MSLKETGRGKVLLFKSNSLMSYSEMVDMALTMAISKNSTSIRLISEKISRMMGGWLSSETPPTHCAVIMGTVESLVAYCRLNNIKLDNIRDYLDYAINVHETFKDPV